MPRRISSSSWSSSTSEVQKRLQMLDGVLRSSLRADGSIDAVKAKALAGKDRFVSLLVSEARGDRNAATLTPAEATAQFKALQKAIQTAGAYDTNSDGKLGYAETVDFGQEPERVADNEARRLILRAAEPVDIRFGETRSSKETNSLAARQAAEKQITELAEFNAETPEGAEALKWAMRSKLAEGHGAWKGSPVFDAVHHSERDWRAYIPIFGRKLLEGRGHLSNAELEARFGPLKAFSERTAREVNGRLLMDYQTGFLAGKDLP